MRRRSWRPWCLLGFLGVGLAVMAGSPNLLAQDSDQPTDPFPQLNGALVSGLSFRGIGPALMSGRIVDLAVDPEQPSTWYLAAGSGGVWKTVNAGTTWQPIFDRYGSYSIGCLAIDPNNRNIVWVGTGENNSQRSVGYGDGLYRSLDGGQSFQKVGLEKSEHIAKIVIDPTDSQIVYVASQGPLWSAGGERGLYKTTDGGRSWKQVLQISENTGVTDVVIDPRDPKTLYAASYQRRRHQWVLLDGGPESTIHKSTDGGNSWRVIDRGLPGGDKGRIGLAISPLQPDILYAIVEAAGEGSGFFRSSDRGETWDRQSSYVSSSPQYYQELVADPQVLDRVYSLDTFLMVTQDGGKTFSRAGERFKHVDNHALVIDPANSNHLLVGCDGGLYESFDGGKNYRFTENLPLTQFYKIAVDRSKPFYYVYGGTQDNATQGGPSQTNNVHGIRNSDWFITVFGDGFDPAVDPEDPNTVYSQWQYGGLVRYDRKTGERVDIKPQESADGPPLRWNWDSALRLSPHNSKRIYYGSQILFRSEDRGDSWTAISPDLTRQIDRNQLKVMDRVWSVDAVAKNMSTSFYGTIVSISESPLAQGLIYVGTDDGLIQVTEDGGANWRKIERFETLDIPEFAYVSDIEASLHDANTVYAVVQNFKRGDFRPFVVKSSDRGKTWVNITGDLPERGSAYTLAEDHLNKGLLFVGTEFGVYCTLDDGKKWIGLGGNLPTICVRDLEIQRDENDLVVGTFGRGIYILDDYSPLRELNAELLEKPSHLFAIPTAAMYLQSDPLGGSSKAFQGSGFFTADNPPFGAVFTLYLKESVSSLKGQRQRKESQSNRRREDTPYPSWEDLKAEDREESPVVWLTIRDASGQVVRRLRAGNSSGIQRVVWDFRYAGLQPQSMGGDGNGPMALPGKYTVEVSRMVRGEIESLGEPKPFECQALGWQTMNADQQRESLSFQQETARIQRVVMASQQAMQDGMERVGFLKAAIERSHRLDVALRKEARDLELQLRDLKDQLEGDPTRASRQEPAMPGLVSRLDQVVGGHWSTTNLPTQTNRQQLALVVEQFGKLHPTLKKLLSEDLPALEQKLEDAGAPWTPGRRLPDWPAK